MDAAISHLRLGKLSVVPSPSLWSLLSHSIYIQPHASWGQHPFSLFDRSS